jgi:HK97 family phage major capsid protein
MQKPFSLVDLIAAKATGTWGRIASHERTIVTNLHETLGLPDSGYDMLPNDVLQTRATPLTAANPSGAGDLDGTKLSGYVAAFQAQSNLLRLGAQTITLDKGSTVTPRGATALVPVWSPDEVTSSTPTVPSFSLLTFTRHNLIIPVTISRQLLIQSDAENIVRTELAKACAVEIDKMGIQGDDTAGRPRGLLNQIGVGTFTGTALDYAAICGAEQAVSDANAVVDVTSLGFLTTPTVAALLKQRYFSSADLPIWRGSIASGLCDDQPAYTSNNVPAGAMIYGDFSQLIVAGWADGLQIDVDAFSQFQSAIVCVRLCISIDIQVRTPLAFSVATGVT